MGDRRLVLLLELPLNLGIVPEVAFRANQEDGNAGTVVGHLVTRAKVIIILDCFRKELLILLLGSTTVALHDSLFKISLIYFILGLFKLKFKKKNLLFFKLKFKKNPCFFLIGQVLEACFVL